MTLHPSFLPHITVPNSQRLHGLTKLMQYVKPIIRGISDLPLLPHAGHNFISTYSHLPIYKEVIPDGSNLKGTHPSDELILNTRLNREMVLLGPLFPDRTPQRLATR